MKKTNTIIKKIVCLLLICLIIPLSSHQAEATNLARVIKVEDTVIIKTIIKQIIGDLEDVRNYLETHEEIEIDINQRYLHKELTEDVKRLEEAYPWLIKTEAIGESEDGRDIHLIKLGKGEHKSLMLGGVHAREIAATPLIVNMINEYAKGYYNEVEVDGFNIKELLDEVTLYIVPMVNPDGMELAVNGLEAIRDDSLREMLGKITNDFSYWKANARGVDLNRNFSNEHWGVVLPGKIRSSLINNGPSSEFYGGERAASERETQAIEELVNNNDFRVMFDIHSRGRISYWNKTTKDKKFNDRSYEIAKEIQRVSGYVPVSKEQSFHGIGTDGNTTDFTVEQGIHSLTIETMLFDIPHPYPTDLIQNEWDKVKHFGLVLAQETVKLAEEDMVKEDMAKEVE